MPTAADYRRNASVCMGLAEHVSDPQKRANMFAMASAWLRLAEQAERNAATDIVYETPFAAPQPETPQPPHQQQQQQQQPQQQTKGDGDKNE